MMVTREDDVRTTLEGMVPHVQRLLMEVAHKEQYADLPTISNFMTLMSRWGVDSDPGGYHERMAEHRAAEAHRGAMGRGDT